MVRQLGPRVAAFGCGAFHALYDLHLFPCAVPSVCNFYNLVGVACWVGSGIRYFFPLLSLSSSLSFGPNRHCETSSIGWGAQCRRVGLGGCGDFGRRIPFPSRNGCVCLLVIVFGRRCARPLSHFSLGTRDRTSTHASDVRAAPFSSRCAPSRCLAGGEGSSQCIAPLRKSARVHKTCLSEGGRDMSRKA
jgi:hypothetical protein